MGTTPSQRRPYWQLSTFKYRQVRRGGIADSDVEPLELDSLSPSRKSSDVTKTGTSKASSFIPSSIERKVQKNQEHQREWVTGVLVCAATTFFVLFVNVILTISAVAKSYAKFGSQDFTSASLYQGECSVSKGWAQGLHLLINGLGTLVLASSNYCMQCLCSPSRSEVDRAHARRKWLDIGVPSVRNLASVSLRRRVLWVLLLVTSLPIHLIYNSAVFSALGTDEYDVVLASAEFEFNIDSSSNATAYENCFEYNTGMNMTAFYSEAPKFDRISLQECVNTYAVDYLTGRGDLILVTNNSTMPKDSLLSVGSGNQQSVFGEYSLETFSWMCQLFDSSRQCNKENVRVYANNFSTVAFPWHYPVINDTGFSQDNFPFNITIPPWSSDSSARYFRESMFFGEYVRTFLKQKNSTWNDFISHYKTGDTCEQSHYPSDAPVFLIDHCLSRKVDEKCQLLFSLPICLTVIFCNIVKVVCMLLTAHDDRREIFLTIGDALSSFLSNPDATTSGRCLLSTLNITKGPRSWKSSLDDGDSQIPESPALLPKKKRWMRAVSIWHWVLMVCLCIVILSVSGFLLFLGISGLNSSGYSATIPFLWQLGFGSVASSTLLDICDADSCGGLISMVLLANTPQIIVSIAYFLYNSTLTTMLLAAEYDGYAVQRKPLRVSWPKGQQRSTFYLSLPYRYSVPLLIVSTLLHWFISQSLFFVEITPYDVQGNPVPTGRIVTCGYSPIAILFAMSLGCIMLATILSLSMKRFKSNIPLAGSCSAAISAACHPLSGDNHALNPVMWGEIQKTQMSVDTPSEEYREPAEDGRSSLDITARDADREGSQVHLLLQKNVSNISNNSRAVHAHCSFTSHEVVTPSLMQMYA